VNVSSRKDSATKWSQVLPLHHLKAEALNIRSIHFLIHSCSTSYV